MNRTPDVEAAITASRYQNKAFHGDYTFQFIGHLQILAQEVERLETERDRLAKENAALREMPDQLLDVHAICDERDRLREDKARLVNLLTEYLAYSSVDGHILRQGLRQKLREAIDAERLEDKEDAT
jgi:hypothetical protein